MLNIVFYFQVHQPYRLREYRVLDICQHHDYFDEKLNREIIQKVGKKSYLASNKLLLQLIDKYEGRFKISYSISGVIIEQFKKYFPEVLESFKDLAKTGCVEFIGETYYHSLAALFDEEEFVQQVRMHKEIINKEFGFSPAVFRNTELIYQDRIGDIVEKEGYKVILTEGVDRILQGRSPLYGYKTYNDKLLMLLKYYTLSDDIAFRFSNRDWPDYPLTVDKFVSWISKLSLIEKGNRELYLNLFMDYETFGEHQWKETGIFDFLKHFPEEVFKYNHLSFAWPSDIIESINYKPENLTFPQPVSWADEERDLSAWLENDMQQNAAETYYELLKKVKNTGNRQLMETIRKLSTSDHLYYMSTKYFQDGDVHKYFSPYNLPVNAYIYFINTLADLEEYVTYKGKKI